MSYSTKLVPGLWRFTVRRNGIPWVERADESAREQDLLDEFGRCAANLREGAAQYFNREQLLLTNYNKTKHAAPIIRTPALVEPLRLKKPLEDAPLCVQIPPEHQRSIPASSSTTCKSLRNGKPVLRDFYRAL